MGEVYQRDGTIRAMSVFVLTRAAVMACVCAVCACDRASEPRTSPPPAGANAKPAAPVPVGPPPAELATRLPADAVRASLPPLPIQASPRPRDYVVAAYEFAALHPEVLKYVPCYCGCEQSGHQHNESCFIASRDADGRVVSWDTHGMG
jgi:hypothetical protein